MPLKCSEIDIEVKNRFFKAVRYIIADKERFGIKNITDVANRIGWPTQSMSRAQMQNNYAVPDKYKVALILIFGVDSDWLMTGRGQLRFHVTAEVQPEIVFDTNIKITNLSSTKSSTKKEEKTKKIAKVEKIKR